MPSGSKYDRTTSSSIQDVFSPTAREFKVPKFQRNYSWGDDKVEPLWADFLETFQDYVTTSDPMAAQYLLGPIVFVKINNEYQVIDGQQRLATLTILFCLARDLIIYLKKPQSGETPDGLSDLIKMTENQRMGQHSSWKLVLNDSDKKMMLEIQKYVKNVHDVTYQSPYDKIKDWNKRKRDPATRDDFTDSMKKLIDAYEILLKKMENSLYTGFESGRQVDEILTELGDQAESNVNEMMRENPEEYGLDITFFDDLQKLKDRNFTDDEKNEYESVRERKNRTTIRYPTFDSYIDRLIQKEERKLKLVKRQEIDNEKTKLATQKMMNNLPKFLSFITHVLENNFVVEIIVEDDEDAFQIFETLNERGLPLSKSNLIKNHVLSQMDNESGQAEISDEWNQIFDEIIGTEQKDDDFIRESLRSRYFDNHVIDDGQTVKASKKSLYKIIKTMVTNEQSARDFVSDLRTDSKFVKLLNDPSKYPDNKTKPAIVGIKSLNAQHIRVPILTASREWGMETDDFDELVKFLVKFFFRFRIVSKRHPGEIDKMMIECATKIKNNDSMEQIKDYLRYEDDEDAFLWNFENDFEPKVESVAKYVLVEISLALGSPDSDVRPVERLSLEHILPRKPEKSQWVNFFDSYNGNTQKKFDKFVHNIGNLTLLTQPINSAVSNRGFKEKRDYTKDGQPKGYNSSQLEINIQTVMNENEWTAEIVENRTQKFASLAKTIWKLD